MKEVEKSVPSHLGLYVLTHSKEVMIYLVHKIVGFSSNKIYYEDTDSAYIHADHHEKFKNAGYVGNNLGQGQNDYGHSGILYGMFLAQKMRLCYKIDKYGTLGEKQLLQIS